jgi:hypothetical protein
MKTFLDRIIKYLDDEFANISTLSKKPKGHYAYEQGLTPTATTPYYVAQLLDNNTNKEDFQEEVSINVPIQVNVYGVKMNVDGQTKSAQEVSIILGDMCVEILEKFKYSQPDIVAMRRTSCTPALPYEDGSKAYFTAIRYNITKQK